MKKISVAFICLFFLLTAACGARVPNTETAEKVSKRFFVKYGKKFKNSEVGVYKVAGTKVLEVQEIHKNMVMATIEVDFIDGPDMITKCVLEKRSFGWKLVSWEKL